MNRSEANEKAKQHISNAGFGTGTNITTHALKCMMVDFYLDNQVKNLGITNVSDLLIAWEQFKTANWWESDAVDVEKVLMDKFKAIYGR